MWCRLDIDEFAKFYIKMKYHHKILISPKPSLSEIGIGVLM